MNLIHTAKSVINCTNVKICRKTEEALWNILQHNNSLKPYLSIVLR